MNNDTLLKSLIDRANAGDDSALGELLQRYRPLLEAMAREQLVDVARKRLGASDIVQQSCLSAVRDFDQFAGEDPGQFVAWLKQIHRRNLQDATRNHTRGKRNANKEVDRDYSQQPRVDQQTASQIVSGHEATEELERAIDGLPPSQSIAVRMRHFEGKSLEEIARQLNRSTAATAGLIKRGLAGIRDVLHADPE